MACTPLLSEDDLYRFRTKQCLRLAKGLCEFGLDRCQYSHSTVWIRRCPYYISLPSYLRYIPIACPYFNEKIEEGEKEDEEKKKDMLRNSILLTNEDGSVNDRFYKYIEENSINKCPLGVECPLAHSFDEIYYHPLVYKTKRCENYKLANCKRYYCPDLHGLAEQRKTKEYFIPFSNKIDIPYFPNVTVVSKIQYGSFKGQNTQTNQKKRHTINTLSADPKDTFFNSNNPSSIKNNWIRQNKNNSLNVPTDINNNNPLQIELSKDANKCKRNTVGNCYADFQTTRKNKLKKEKNFNYKNINTFDNKYSLYVHILKKFPFLFDLNVSDISKENKKESKVENNKNEKNETVKEKENEDNNEQEKEEQKTISENKNKENKIPLKNAEKQVINQNGSYYGAGNTEEKCENTNKIMKNKEENNVDTETEELFLNYSYHDILNFILKRNAQLSKEYFLKEKEKKMKLKSELEVKKSENKNNMEETKNEVDVVINGKELKQNYAESIQPDISKNKENDVTISKCSHVDVSTFPTMSNEYECVLNCLRNILCLLYFTMDSCTHTVFDYYVQKLSRQVHLECKKRRNAAVTDYLKKTINNVIQNI